MIPTPIKSTAPHFYKYSSLERPEQLDWLKAIILKHELFFPNLTQLNDPADGRPKLTPQTNAQLISFMYEEVLRRNPNLSREAQEKERAIIDFNVRQYGTEAIQRIMVKSLYEELKDSRIYSLSKRYDNMGMWAKYAANHSGYCLEFSNEGSFATACDVAYGEYLLDLSDVEQRAKPFFFFCKSEDWSNEEEVRFLLRRGSNPVVKIEPRWSTRLILGKDVSDTHQQNIREWAKQRNPELAVVNAYFDELHHVIALRA
jgi:hypothetical protein